MERQPRHVVAEPDRGVGAQDVNAMSANRQLFSELGGDDAAAADRRIADDADVHGTGFIRVERIIGSRTINPSARLTPASAPNWASRLSMSCMNSGVFSLVATALPGAGGVNCDVWHSSASRF